MSCTNNRKHAVHIFYKLQKEVVFPDFTITQLFTMLFFNICYKLVTEVTYKNSHRKLQSANCEVAEKYCFRPEHHVVQ